MAGDDQSEWSFAINFHYFMMSWPQATNWIGRPLVQTHQSATAWLQATGQTDLPQSFSMHTNLGLYVYWQCQHLFNLLTLLTFDLVSLTSHPLPPLQSKARRKKFIIFICCVVLLAIVGVIIYFAIPKSN